MKIYFIPHKQSIIGYNRVLFRIGSHHHKIFLLATVFLIILSYSTRNFISDVLLGKFSLNYQIPNINITDINIDQYIQRFISGANNFLVNLPNTLGTLLNYYSNLNFISDQRFENFFAILFWIGLGWIVSRVVVSLNFYYYRRYNNNNLYYQLKALNEPLPANYGYKLPLGIFSETVYSIIVISFLVTSLFAFSHLTFDYVSLFSMFIFTFIDYSHILITFNNVEIVYTVSTFGKTIKPYRPSDRSIDNNTYDLNPEKGFNTRITKSKVFCPNCKIGIYDFALANCPKCGFIFTNRFCPICYEEFLKKDERAFCFHCHRVFHREHFLTYVNIYKKCPLCKQALSYKEVFNSKEFIPEETINKKTLKDISIAVSMFVGIPVAIFILILPIYMLVL